MEFRWFQASSRREKGEEGKMRIGMGVGAKEGVGCLGRGERVGEWAGGRGGGGARGSKGWMGCSFNLGVD